MARIETIEGLRALYGPVSEKAQQKVIGRLDEICRRWLAACPFAVIATSDGATMDVSPKGDGPGFIQVEDDSHILVPDWPGNNRIDGYRNIVRNPAVGIITMVPGVRETIRINGVAEIRDDEALRRRFVSPRGSLPITVLRIEVREVFMHCAKAFMRSRLWEPESWPAKADVPSGGEILKAHCALDGPAITEEEMDRWLTPSLY